MYIDATLLFSKDQTISVSAPSEKIISSANGIGGGLPIYPLVQIATPFEDLTSLTVFIQSNDAVNQAEITEDSWVTIAESGTLTQEQLNTIRTLNFGSLPPDCGNFLRLKYEVIGSPTKGSITAALVLDRQV